MQVSTLSRRAIALAASTALGVGLLALATPSHAAPPTLGVPEILGGQVSNSPRGSLTGSDPFTTAAYATVLAPASVVEPTFTVRWSYTNSDPVSAGTRLARSTIAYYSCDIATFNGSCTITQVASRSEGDRYTTSNTFLGSISGAPAGKYVFPSLILEFADGSAISSRGTTGSLVTAPPPSVNPPAITGADEAAKTVPLSVVNSAFMSFNAWSDPGARTPNRTLRIFDCPAPFDQAVPPAQPSGCTRVLENSVGARLAPSGEPMTHTWAAGRYVVATDTMALASPGLLTAHERAVSYRIVDTTAADPNAPANPNAVPAPGAAGAGEPSAQPGGAGAGAGGPTDTPRGIDSSAVALIGISPDTAPLVGDNGLGERNAVTLRLIAPARVARGTKRVYRAVLAPTNQAGRVVFTIARPKADGTMQVLKKASATVKKGSARKAITVPKTAAKGRVLVYASYLPKPSTSSGMTVSKRLALK